MSIKTSAPGNVFLFGEHSVVYERPAVLAAINKRTYSEIEKRDDRKVKVQSEGYGVIDSSLEELKNKEYDSHEDYEDVMDPLRDLIGIVATENDLDSGFDLKITSEISKDSGGMSSSTAVLCSVLKALSEAFGLEIPQKDYFKIVYPLQVKIHGGKASGSEITSSSMGGYNKFVIDKSREGTDFNFENLGQQSYSLVIGDSGIEAMTGDTVSYVKKGWDNDEDSYEEAFDKIAEIVKEGKEALVSGKAEKVGELINENQIILRILGVSHPKLEKMIQNSLDAGAYGAKLSGGGKGGIMLALVPDGKENQVAQAIEEAGGEAVITEVGVEGARVEH